MIVDAFEACEREGFVNLFDVDVVVYRGAEVVVRVFIGERHHALNTYSY